MPVIFIPVKIFYSECFKKQSKHIQLVPCNCEIISTEAAYFSIFSFFSSNYGDFQMSNNDLIQYDWLIGISLMTSLTRQNDVLNWNLII